MINILLWIVFGGIAGWVASLIVNTSEMTLLGSEILANVVVGIIGAFVGGFIADKVGIGEGVPGADRPTGVWSFVWAVVGAIILLVVLNLIF